MALRLPFLLVMILSLLTAGFPLVAGATLVSDRDDLGVPGGLTQEAADARALLCLGEAPTGGEVDPRVIADVQGALAVSRTESSEGDADREDVLHALAIHANNGEPVQFDELQDQDVVRREVRQALIVPTFKENNVLSALALGIHSDAIGAVEALACAARVAVGAVEDRVSQRVELGREETFGAIALHNQGADLDWRDVADISRTEARGTTWDYQFTATEEQVFFALSLGIGGRDRGES